MRQTSNFKLNAGSIAIGLIIVLPFMLFWQWVLKGQVLYWGTLLLQFWPWHTLVKTALLNGQWPLWNPLLGNGTPLLANLQSAVFYPPNLMYLLIPVEHALTLSVIVHLILAGLLMYLYGRHLGLLPFAAAVSALAYMFSGYIISRTQFTPMVNAAAWFPLLLFLSDKLVTKRGGIYIVWLALALAIQFLAGHAQLWFYGLWLIGPYIVFRSWQATSSSLPGKVRFTLMLKTVAFLAVAVGLALLVSAVQILPTAEFVTQSARSGGAQRTFALTYSFWPWRLITLLAPDFFGHPAQGNYWGYAAYWEDHAYIGVLPFILAMVAVWRYFKTKRSDQPAPTKSDPLQVVPFFAALIPVSLVLAMGWNTPIYLWVFDTVPGFGFFQAPARLLIWYTIAVTVLAGVGAQTFQLTPKNRRIWHRLLAAAIALTVAGFAAQFFISRSRNLTFLIATQTLGVVFILAIVILLFQPKDSARSKMNLWQAVVIAFISIDLLLAAWPLIPTLPGAIYTRTINSAEVIKTQPGQYRFFADDTFTYNTTYIRYFNFKAFGPPETAHWLALKEALVPNMGVYAGLPSANNNDPLVVAGWQQLTRHIKDAETGEQARLLSLMSAGYFISPGDNEWPEFYNTGFFTIQQVPDVLPRAYFVPRAFAAKTNQEALSRLTAPDFDARQEVVIISNDTNYLQVNPDATSILKVEPVLVQEFGPNQLQLEVTAPGSGFVVLTDTFYPGWQAAINDQSAQILQANLAFRAIAVEAGQHKIDLYYRPPTFTIGLWISAITCLIIVGIIARKIFINRKSP